mmetsp:Transcript_26586/g.42625  ORF Transcript_26586/g.42625 Transcript_26586/m.42625 type:complete len:88 (+) Transcript_26586:18-281(+)
MPSHPSLFPMALFKEKASAEPVANPAKRAKIDTFSFTAAALAQLTVSRQMQLLATSAQPGENALVTMLQKVFMGTRSTGTPSTYTSP